MTDPARADRVAAFAARHGRDPATLAALPQDAGFRRYLRCPGHPPAVVMDAPPTEPLGPFLAMRARLEAAGLSVPALLAEDAADGLLLLEDFGAGLFPAVLTDANRDALYDAATDALAALHAIPAPPDLPAWGAAQMRDAAAATFLDWWWPAAFGAPPTQAVREDFAAAMDAMLATLPPAVLLHRDYFAGNLFWLPDRAGVRRVGVIDFQDAARGPAAYDLVSLVQDARRDLPAALAQRQIGRTLAATGGDRAVFEAAFAVCAAQRHLRVAALWVRLDRRDGKPGYLQHGPRCWALLDAALAHPATAPLAAFLDAHVPRPLRGNPQ